MKRLYRLEEQELAAAEALGAGRDPVTPRPAAGVILARDTTDGPQVLLLRRRSDMGFAAGAHVFPGGTLDEEDSDEGWESLIIRPPAAAITAAGGPHSPSALAFVVAALRETFEETGVLLSAGELPPPAEITSGRSDLIKGRRSFLDLLREWGIRLAADRLVLCARWITPESMSRRYDARFFLEEAPPDLRVEPERGELVEHLWIAPGEALQRYFGLRLRMLFPTAKTLSWLEEGDSVAEWRQRFLSTEIRPILPRLRRTDGGVLPVMPGEPGYDERDGDG